MKRLAAPLLAAAACVAASACSKEPALRTEEPTQLVEDLARRLIPPARSWLAEEESRDESVTLRHPSSAEISRLAIGFLRLVNHARNLLEPFLPPETRGQPVTPDLSQAFRALATSLGGTAADDVTAAEESRTPNSARVRLTIAAPGREAQSWIFSLSRDEKVWRFTAAPRRG